MFIELVHQAIRNVLDEKQQPNTTMCHEIPSSKRSLLLLIEIKSTTCCLSRWTNCKYSHSSSGWKNTHKCTFLLQISKDLGNIRREILMGT